jgi:GntR family phosphonate transport system transcriptional regulator
MNEIDSPEMLPLNQRRGAMFLWQRVVDTLQRDISSGRYVLGAQLPTELELAETFEVHRNTVRHALRVLRDRGVVRIEQGRGSFVQERLVHHQLGPKTRMTAALRDIERVGERRFLSTARVRADASIATDLKIKKNQFVRKVETVTTADGVIVSISSRYFPLPRFAGIEKLIQKTGSLTQSWLQYGVNDYRRYETRISAIALSGSDADLLGLSARRPAMFLTNINVDADDIPISVTHTRISPQHVELVVRF